jgi:hypothetical protein
VLTFTVVPVVGTVKVKPTDGSGLTVDVQVGVTVDPGGQLHQYVPLY